MRNRSEKEMIRDFTSLTKDLKRQGINPGFYFMDNESSTALNLTMTTINTNYQLFPLSNHRAKNTEREIQTFKNRFIAGLCSVDKYFHLHLWDRLLQQATISLNLIRQSRTLPHIPTYAHIRGEFDFKRTPLAPHGTRVVINNRQNDCTSCSPHREDDCYIGPETEHYRCHK